MRGERATVKIQRNNYFHGSCEPSLTGKTTSVLKATSHSTIFDIPMRRQKKPCAAGKIYKNYREIR